MRVLFRHFEISKLDCHDFVMICYFMVFFGRLVLAANAGLKNSKHFRTATLHLILRIEAEQHLSKLGVFSRMLQSLYPGINPVKIGTKHQLPCATQAADMIDMP